MAANNFNKRIDEILNYLEYEQELYGDFFVSSQLIDEISKQTEDAFPDKLDQIKKSKLATQVSEPKAKLYMEYFNAQDKIFTSKDNYDIYDNIAGCNTLAELEELCNRAKVLETDLANTRLVFGVGNPSADLMLVGEAPGAEEDKQGKPFVGRGGQLLNKILAAIHFERKDLYIANILKHRPPHNRNPEPEERKRSLPFLLRQIDLVNPKLILCLGRVSANTLLANNKSLGSMRQTLHPFRNDYELMVTYHPAALLRNPGWKRPTWEDVQLLRKRYDELGCQP